jgi:hypothetical protein
MPRCVLLLILLLACTSSWAQIPLRGGPRRDPSRTVVGNYCRMDYEGLRLTTWKENHDWQGFTIVSQYEVLPNTDGLRSATVDVRYSVLGRFELGLGYSAEPGREEVSFFLKDVDDEWKIDQLDPPIAPHVSKARAIAWMKNALAAEKDTANKIALQKALKDLGAGAATP